MDSRLHDRPIDTLQELHLRYGMNPDQSPARAFVAHGALPLTVLNGAPSYINLLDALAAWQLVRDLSVATGLPAAASFKHTAPAGAALGLALTPDLAQAYRVTGDPLTPLAAAYVRARGADRVASYGDFVAVSAPMDGRTAAALATEVSDGVIAPGYAPEALATLYSKKHGAYLILQIDPSWEPELIERREVFGLTLEQPRNRAPVELGRVVSQRTELPETARRDLLLAATTLKYTPSNSICLAVDGQVIGVGAGQQSRIQCTRLACGKAEVWWLRQHPRALALQYRPGTSRTDRDTAVEAWIQGEASTVLVGQPAPLSVAERTAWLSRLQGVALASDGLIPFRDNLERAAQTGVTYVWQSGGASRDDQIIAAADAHQMVMCFSGRRLFHH